MASSLGDAERESFRDLLWKLLEAHDAEIASLKQRIENSGQEQELENNIHVEQAIQDKESDDRIRDEPFIQGKESDERVVKVEEGDRRSRSRSFIESGSWSQNPKALKRSESQNSFSSTYSLEHTDFEATDYMKYRRYDLICYWVDTWISRRRSQGFALASLILISVVVFGAIWTLMFSRSELAWYENLLDGFWLAWTYMADPGTHAGVVDNESSVIETQPERFLSAMIAAVGIVFMGATLGMIVDIIREKMEDLRKGKSSVVERNHSLILGWTEKAVSIIEELCFANESAGGGTIVVLSTIPKEDIERDFAFQFPNPFKGTRVVFRTGNPMVVTDLMKVGAPTARATIILSNDGDPDNADAETLRVMLSLKTLPFKLEGHVVAEVRDIDNQPLVKMVGGDVVESLVSHDILGRLMLTAARQPGLAKVYEALLGFQGDEFYVSEWPELVGVTFGDLIERFPNAVPVGIFTADNELILNPQHDREMAKGDQILVIAQDDDTYKPEEPALVEVGSAPVIAEENKLPEKILFCGWRRDIRDIVQHLDDTLQEGSEIHMISGYMPIEKRREVLMDDGLDVDGLKRTRLIQHYGNPSIRRKLAALPMADFTSCMIFADQAFETDTMQADSHSLATLLLLRDLQLSAKNAQKREPTVRNTHHGLTISDTKNLTTSLDPVVSSCPVVCEVLDPKTQKTIMNNQYLRHSSEFCQTNKITAQLIAMVAENRSVNVLFDELLGVHGNGVNVVPSSRFTDGQEFISFWTMAKRASRMNVTLIGFKNKKHVSLNPLDKSALKQWHAYGMIVISSMGARNSQVFESRTALAPKKDKLDVIAFFEGIIRDMDRADCVRVVEAMRHIHQMSMIRDNGAGDTLGHKATYVV